MEILQSIGTSNLSTIVEDLVKSTSRHVGYMFRFKSIIEDLNKETENLRSKLEDIQRRVDRAKEDTEEIEEVVQKWLRHVREVVADVQNMEIESIEKQTCLNGWCPNCMWKYQLAKKAEKKKNIMLKFSESGQFDIISHRAPLTGLNVFSSTEFKHFESNQWSFNQIIEALKDEQTTVVGLYGMGGVGKTTLAKAVVNKSKEENIFNKFVMVVVSQTPNIKSIQDQIADFLNFDLHEKSIEGRAERLSMRLKDEKNILIILDDIWVKLDLTIIGIPVDDHPKNYKIFLTTRRQQVCIDMRCQKRIPLDVLNEKEGLLLLKRQVGLNDDSPTLNQLAKEVANECKGLPLAIVTVGSALKEKTTDEWKIMIQKLKKSKLVDIDIVDAEVYACLKLSYDYLKNEETKECFLLCSLFPEDQEIDMEELLRYGLGLGWYQDTGSIDDARIELRVMVNNLKTSSLLLDADEGFVKMHDVVRDVALWITSKGEYVFMVEAGMGLTEWPKHKGLEQCTAISLIKNEIEVLPDDVVCPKLSILLLGSYYYYRSEICEKFFKEMKALKVVTLVGKKISLKSLRSLADLVTLQLIDCELRDISSLKKLTKLKILSLQDSMFDESLKELKELSKLRILDLRGCYLEKIPVDVIPRLSRLEELHIISKSSKEQEVEEGTSVERSNANLSELRKLDGLTILSLRITVRQRLPKDFVLLKKLLKYDIRVNAGITQSWKSHPKSRSLTIRDIEGTSLFAFKTLYEDVEYLKLKNIMGCYQNIIPSIDETGLNELRRLSLKDLEEVECIIDMTQQHVPSTAFSNLVHLSLYSVDLREICNGGSPPRRFLGNLETVEVNSCDRMSCLFLTSLIQRLRKLKEVSIRWCGELQDVFLLEGLCYAKENPFLLSSLSSLHLRFLRNLRNIWKGPTQQVSLQSLTSVEVTSCVKLIYVFTLNLARSLLQLQQLSVTNCDSLEHIVEIKREENVAAGGGNDVLLPKLRILKLERLKKLINFCSENYTSTWPALQELTLDWNPSLVANIQTTKETLRILHIEGGSDKFWNVVAQLKNLEELRISCYRGVQVILEVEQQISLPNLKRLELGELEDVEWLYKGPTHLLSLPNLQHLQVYKCKRLRHLLKTIENNLSSIDVIGCEKLKTLFPVTIAPLDLQQLKSLEVRSSPQLEEIFGHKDEVDMTQLQLVLPQLQLLILEQLESLVNFCPSGYHLIFPSLSFLCVDGCPKITTRFSVDQNGAVHAQATVEHSPLQTARHIICWDRYSHRQMLPAYIGR